MFASVCILSIIVAWASGENVKTYETLLREGDQHVLSGRANYTSAIAAYTKAIELNAEDTQAFLRRAEVHQLLKNLREAEIDLSTVLEKEPDNKRALIKKAALHILAGNLSSARLTYEGLLLVWKSENNKKKYDETNLLLNEISDALTAIQEAERDPFGKSLACIIALAPLLQKFSESLELKLKRVECAVNSSNHDLSLSELRKILALNPNSTAAIFLQARELKSLGAIEGAEKHIKRCLTLDPENRSCRNLQKEIKSARKRSEELERFMSQKKWNQVTLLVDSWIQAAETNKNNVLYEQPSISDLKHKQCTAYLELKMVEKGLKACTEVIDRIGHDAPGVWELHILRAELHLLDENISAASEEVELAKRGNVNQKKIHDMLAKIEKIKQQMSRKNYYKILGVSKKASKKQIRKAFRELALKYHPDKVATDDDSERERLAALYRDINEAKEVLLDDEKRKRYDEGEDVMNKQQQQQQQQQDPFAQFMNAGFRFQFH